MDEHLSWMICPFNHFSLSHGCKMDELSNGLFSL